MNGWNEEDLDYKAIKNNRDKNYAEITLNKELVKKQGRLAHLHHELMISRFHYMLERSCKKSSDLVELQSFTQGSDLWNNLEVKKAYIDRSGQLVELDETEPLPHRPDAYFILHFPTIEGEDQTLHYFYEADRKTMNIKKMKDKFRSHYHYVMKQKLHKEHYGIDRIRAVLVESTDNSWANHLRVNAGDKLVSNNPSELFWFTTSTLFGQKPTTVVGGKEKEVPIYLDKPEVVFGKKWATPKHSDDMKAEEFLSIIP